MPAVADTLAQRENRRDRDRARRVRGRAGKLHEPAHRRRDREGHRQRSRVPAVSDSVDGADRRPVSRAPPDATSRRSMRCAASSTSALYRGSARRRDHRARARPTRPAAESMRSPRSSTRTVIGPIAPRRGDRRAAARARRDAPRADARGERAGRRRELGAGVRSTRRGAGAVGVGARASVAGRDESTTIAVGHGRRIFPPIAAIEREAFSDPWSEQSFREALAHPSIYFVARARVTAGEVLGYVVAWFVADEGKIANLAVAPSGWGRASGARCSMRRSRGGARGRRPRCIWRCGTRTSARGGCTVRDGSRRSAGGAVIISRPVEDAIVLRRMLKYRWMCEVSCERASRNALLRNNLLARRTRTGSYRERRATHSLARRNS